MSLPVKQTRLLGLRRRLFLLGFVVLIVIVAGWPMAASLAHGGWTTGKAAFFLLFILLLAQVVFASVVAGIGWWILRRGSDPAGFNSRESFDNDTVGKDLPATAIVMPIYNEDVNRVFQGLRSMFESLQKTGRGGAFDFFILSDTSETNCWIAEQSAWFDLCKSFHAFGRIFLSPTPNPIASQEWKHRRLLPSLGGQLSLHDRARRR